MDYLFLSAMKGVETGLIKASYDVGCQWSIHMWKRFEEYDQQGDFVGMDMTRKFIQMVSLMYILFCLYIRVRAGFDT